MKVKVFFIGAIQTNTVLLQDGDSCILIDLPFGCQRVADYVKNNNLTVVAILLTHGHFDHCGGVLQLKRLLDGQDIPVYLHEKDLSLAQNAQLNPWGVECENCQPTHFVEEGSLEVGDFHLEVLHTPGHTQGSVVYLCQEYMLAGDTLFCGGVGRTDLEGGNYPQLLQSLQKLKNLNKNYNIISGHGQCTTLHQEISHNPYLN